ncbi:neuroglobin-like [Brachionus plicatilis]|uniref:Neuroglobin-like n=1 Tax=Brachionus plicatilis TaxID=10195 RepID=A0A3M7S1W9_BRAPC|nr:neuroglobin-like [Brachionus plicatilis]
MGCASSNEAKEAKTNGAAKSAGDNGEAGPEPAAPKQNPYMSLTPKDVFSLKMSWKGIRRCLEETGTSAFTLLFNAHPDYLTCYEKLKDIPRDRLYTSTPFLDYVTSVMETMDLHVTELDDAQKTHQNIKKFGTDFKKIDIAKTIFDDLRGPLLKSIEQTLGDRYTDRMRNIYEIFIDYYLKTLAEGYGT